MAIEQLGPYRVVRMIGRGGMGAVYEGAHAETGERVALKILAPAFADDESFRARFAAEIEALKILRHPNIVRLIGFGEEDGTLFYAMELVEGESLHEALRSGKRFSWQEVIDIANQVANALKHAHDHGIIHRDLKPANLLRTPQGLVKLMDFGIAKLFGSTQLTSVGGVVGTVEFMAPEQAEGGTVTYRSDLYSLGAVMFALLAGRPPFTGRNPTEVLHRMRHQQPPCLHSLQRDVPEALEELVMELLARDPQKRVATALVLSKRLRAMRYALTSISTPEDGSDTQDHSSTDGPNSLSQAPSGTAVEATREFNPNQPASVPWENETVFTAAPELHSPPPPSGEEELRLLPVGDDRRRQPGPSARTAASTALTSVDRQATTTDGKGRTSRYVVATEETGGYGVSWGQWLSFTGLACLLILLVGAALYMQQPPSAEKLFARIENVVGTAERGDYMYARQDIDQFLRLYADDERAERVRQWQTEHDAYRLWGKLERKARRLGGIDYLPAVERDFVVAMREEGRDLSKAVSLHRQLIDTYDQQAKQDEQAAVCVTMSRRKLPYLEAALPSASAHPMSHHDTSEPAVKFPATDEPSHVEHPHHGSRQHDQNRQ